MPADESIPAGAEGPSARRRVSLAMGSLAAVAILLSTVLLALVSSVAETVGEMRRDELAMHEGLMLGVAVREQYIHEAHTLIERTDAHLAHHHSWVEEVRRSADLLEARVPASERWRVAHIVDASATIDGAFRSDMFPAMERGDLESVRTEHRHIDELVTRAANDADAVAAALELRMHEAHVRAEGTARMAVAIAAFGGLLAVFLAGYHGWRVRARVLRPLAALADSTQLIARGQMPSPFVDGDREVRAVGAALRQLASDLREREARLVASERMAVVGQLAAGVAHEVNNPIGIIRGYLSTMMPEATSAQLKEELRILDEEAYACQRIAEDLVAFARTNELRIDDVNVAELASDLAARLGAASQLRGASVSVQMEPVVVGVDAGRIRQVLSNLLRNAAEALPGGPIEVTGDRRGGVYRIEVRDRGPGVPAEDRDRVFEPFYGKRPGGSGLGLAVCMGVVRAHSGSIHIEDREGGGTTVVVELPTRAEARAA